MNRVLLNIVRIDGNGVWFWTKNKMPSGTTSKLALHPRDPRAIGGEETLLWCIDRPHGDNWLRVNPKLYHYEGWQLLR